MRTRLAVATVVALVAAVAADAEPATTHDDGPDLDFARHVDPFVGTTAEGNTFPGPVAPFGMIQWGPDTLPAGAGTGEARTYTFQIPQDPAGLAEALGGRSAMTARLDEYFAPLGTGPSGDTAPWLANQPASNSPWLYDWLGQPARTQRVVRHAITGVLTPTPSGLPGNDDLGHLASWYVFGALGFNPTVPGTDILALGSPLFPRTTIHLPGGDVRIVAPAAAPGAPYVHGLTVNGRQWDKPWLRLADVAHGGTLRFELDTSPDPLWGSATTAAPPSFGPNETIVCTR